MGWNRNDLQRRGTQPWQARTGVEDNQGPPSMPPGVLQRLQVPQNPTIEIPSFRNPFRLRLYGPIPLLTTSPTIVLQSNRRRAYLLLQNQGPGNIFVNFGQDASLTNCLQLVTTQALEQIGGGYVDVNGHSIPQDFVASDYISVITDTANTNMLAGEGVSFWYA
jgi:hypothetical protein